MGTSWGTKSPPRLVRMDEPSEVIEPGENQSEDVGEVEQPVPTDTIATTARLRLRRLRDADLADLFALESVEDVWQAFHLGEQPTEEAVGALLQAMIAGQGALGEQSQRHSVAIEELDAPRFVGIIDLTAIGDLGDFAIAITPEARGHHYASEALPPYFEWCAVCGGVTTIIGAAHPDNAASIAAMQAAGMVEVDLGAATADGENVEVRTFQWTVPAL